MASDRLTQFDFVIRLLPWSSLNFVRNFCFFHRKAYIEDCYMRMYRRLLQDANVVIHITDSMVYLMKNDQKVITSVLRLCSLLVYPWQSILQYDIFQFPVTFFHVPYQKGQISVPGNHMCFFLNELGAFFWYYYYSISGTER